MSSLRLAIIVTIGLVAVIGGPAARANATFEWVTTAVTNFDSFICGTAQCQSYVLSELAATPSPLNGGSEQLTVTDAMASGGATSGSSPGGCANCTLPPGIVSLPLYGTGRSSLALNFAAEPFLSGSITVTGTDFGYSLTGSGSDWSGYFDGEASFFGTDCYTRGVPGCQVTGYWVDPNPLSSPTPAVAEPPGLALGAIEFGMLLLVLRWGARRHRKNSESTASVGHLS